jgi:hypothetical protein
VNKAGQPAPVPVPNDPTIERHVLGELVSGHQLDGFARMFAVQDLQGSHFYTPRHVVVFSAIAAVGVNGSDHIDVGDVAQWLIDHRPDFENPHRVLADLVLGLPQVGRLTTNVARLEELRILREAQVELEEARLVLVDRVPHDERVGELRRRVARLRIIVGDEPPRFERTPPVLSPEALHGVFGRLTHAVTSTTEASEPPVLFQALATYGLLCTVGATGGKLTDNPYMPISGDVHQPIIWVSVVGETARARKGTSWAAQRRVYPDVAQLRGFGSGEALIEALEERPRVLLFETELSRVLAVSARSGSTLSETLRDAWDHQKLSIHVRSAGKSVSIDEGAYRLAVMGHTTMTDVEAKLSDVDIGGGLANRLAWIWAPRARSSGGAAREVELRRRAAVPPRIRPLRERHSAGGADLDHRPGPTDDRPAGDDLPAGRPRHRPGDGRDPGGARRGGHCGMELLPPVGALPVRGHPDEPRGEEGVGGAAQQAGSGRGAGAVPHAGQPPCPAGQRVQPRHRLRP